MPYVQTDKQSYVTGETAVVSGTVPQLIPGNSQVRLDIYDSDGNVDTTNLGAILEDKNFTTYIGTTGKEPSQYRIAVTYGRQTGQTILTVTSPQSFQNSFDKNASQPIRDNVTTPVNDQNVTTVKRNLENNKFIKYENMDYLLSILYPSNWTKIEENLQPHHPHSSSRFLRFECKWLPEGNIYAPFIDKCGIFTRSKYPG